jgi:hypothetical protein
MACTAVVTGNSGFIRAGGWLALLLSRLCVKFTSAALAPEYDAKTFQAELCSRCDGIVLSGHPRRKSSLPTWKTQ